jgi:hypothetical protein
VLLTVQELCDRVQTELGSLIDELTELTGRGGDAERHAWQKSLPRFAEAITSASLDDVHVHFSRRVHHVSLEYQLPGASSWCDVVLLGRTPDRPSAVIVELKDWETKSDRPGIAEGLVEHRGVQELHPSDQVRGYVEYCRHFHSAVLDRRADVHGFVLLTTGLLKHPYLAHPNDQLAANYPVFSMAHDDVTVGLPRFLRTRLTECDAVFASEFSTGTFRQERGFMRQIGRAVLNGHTPQFELLDNQRRAWNLCLAKVREAVVEQGDSKRVVIVEGPPGSGKSAVAARLWAGLVTDVGVPPGNVVLVTTSQSQSSNWTFLLDRASSTRAGRGIARKATSFSPLDIPQLSRLRKITGTRDLYKRAAEWRAHFADLASQGRAFKPGTEDNSCLVSLVDEAHALINPEREHGVGQYGFVTGLGPQAFHIIRCSRVSVFFVDPQQSFRARENTTLEDIESWALEQGASVDRVSLQGVQFRCAGSAEYVAWVESILGGSSASLNSVYASAWYSEVSTARERSSIRRAGNVVALPIRTRSALGGELVAAEGGGRRLVAQGHETGSTMDFRLFRDPFEMESELRRFAQSHTVRLVSSYSRPWVSATSTFPHGLPPEAMDFHEVIQLPNGEARTWSRPWNFVPDGDYTGFVAGRDGLPIHDDPLCEVGCTYAVRGFDFDYLGLLWLNDLVWRSNRWVVQLDNVHESGISVLVRQAKREGSIAPVGPRGVNVLEKVRQAYRILLTRAIKGMFVWIPDDETREHVRHSLGLE